MRKVLIVLLVLFFAVPLMAEDKPYRIMEFTLLAGNALDCYSTRALLKRPGFEEANPFSRYVYGNDFRAIVSTVVVSGIEVWGFESLRKKNKTLGYILMGVIIAAKTYTVAHNFHYLSHH